MSKQFKLGVAYGVLATLTMSFFMLVSVMMEVSPLPMPVPVALTKRVLGNLPKQALIPIGLTAHFLYGGLAGGLFAIVLADRVSLWKGLAWGALLWLVMQVVFLPLLGWGPFGNAIAMAVAVITLLLHLLYGSVLGSGLKWHHTSVPDPREERKVAA